MVERSAEGRPLPQSLFAEFNQLKLVSLGTFIILQEADDILNGKKDGDKAVAQREFQRASELVARAFLRHHSWGMGDEYFALNGLILETPLVEPSILFKALSMGWDQARKDQYPSAEIEKPSVYVATVARNNTGKGIVSDYLRENHGFVAYPLSDRVKELAAAYGNDEPFDRDVLIGTGKKVKEDFGAGVLIRAAARMFTEPGRSAQLLFDGLRTEAEAKDFLSLGDDKTKAILIAVVTGEERESDQLLRFQRAIKRGGPKDPQDDSEESFIKFCEQDDREGEGIDAAMQLATHIIVNKEGEQESAENQLQEIFSEIGL